VKIDLEQIKSLLDVVSTNDISEISIESGEEKITIKKQATVLASTMELPLVQRQQLPAQVTMPAAQAAGPAEAEKKAQQVDEDNNGKGLVPITSPMVGTFYRARSPSNPPFVEVGDVIKTGQTVCIIEAMKLMNDMPTEVAGRIVKVCVENGTTVEYGQPLFMVNPKV
jgi:acetyl-CoA carboxylase biotin carboxyl carrier protein